MSAGPLEIEIKLRFASVAEAAARIEGLGLRPSSPRVFEANTIYDTPERSLKERGELLRLREAGDKIIVTWKGPANTGRHKSRPEKETTAGNAEIMAQILGHLGLFPAFRYEKYRTEYTDAGTGVVTLDETPIGCFVELEGPPDWIDHVAERLGCTESDYITASYGRLYLQACERTGTQPADMVFDTPRNSVE